MLKMIKKLFLTNTIVIDVDLVPERVFLFQFHLVILRRSTERYESYLLPFLSVGGVYPFVIFPCNFISRLHSLSSTSTAFPAARTRESTVITVQSCYFSFIRCALFGKSLGSLHSSRFYMSAGGYMNSTAL